MTTRPDHPALQHPTTPSHWTEGNISLRTGNCNVLLIAPHGHQKDDTNTGKLARSLADQLNCYAVINEKYQKPLSARVPNAMPKKFIADLYKQADANLPALKPLFLDWAVRFKTEILNNYSSLFIFYIHGIATVNSQKVARLINEFKNNPNHLQAIIGYGQWRNNGSRPTADIRTTVKPFLERLRGSDLHTAIAPTRPIKVKNKDTWYCGWDKNRLNQYLFDAAIMHCQLNDKSV